MHKEEKPDEVFVGNDNHCNFEDLVEEKYDEQGKTQTNLRGI